MVEIIVKYNGDINAVAIEIGASAEILSSQYAILTIDENQINNLYSYSQIEDIERPLDLYISASVNLISSCIGSTAGNIGYNLSGEGIIVGIIDSGIDYTHPDFRNPDGTTRILALWDQTENHNHVYYSDEINAALSSENPYEIVPSLDNSGHGTAVAGIAAGNGAENIDYIGAAPKADLIIVKANLSSTFFTKTTSIMRGIKFCNDTARSFNKPIAINISFGMNEGSHKGDSLFEDFITSAASVWKNVIVIPTGNEGTAAHHYTAKLKNGETTEVNFFTASGLPSFYVSMWKNFADIITVELISPSGNSSGVLTAEQITRNVRLDNSQVSILYSQPTRYSTEQEVFFNVSAISGTISAGLWKIKLSAINAPYGIAELWLPTIEEVTLKTYFTNPNFYASMTIPSTAHKIIRVAGYNARLGSIAEFSGAGFENIALPIPDIAAPCVAVSAPRVGGGYDSFTGTSFAAPFVTGAAALMMEWGITRKNAPFLYGERIRAYLRLGARRNPDISYPDPIRGYGELCFSSTLAMLQREAAVFYAQLMR